MTIAFIRERLKLHQPFIVDEAQFSRAAVAVVLRDSGADAEVIVIHRALRRGDPWSGHMALPGGRQQAADADLFATAARETFEEVGVDLHPSERLGQLDDVRAVGRGRLLDLVIRPFVCAISAPVTLVLDRREVQSALWVPLGALRGHDARGTYHHRVQGQDLERPAFVYGGHTIWGLTHRILNGLLGILS